MKIKDKFLRLSVLNRGYNKNTLTAREIRERERLLRILRRRIARVTDDYTRYVLELRYLEAMKWDDIADRLYAVSTDAIRKMCERRIRRMRS